MSWCLPFLGHSVYWITANFIRSECDFSYIKLVSLSKFGYIFGWAKLQKLGTRVVFWPTAYCWYKIEIEDYNDVNDTDVTKI